MYLCDNRFHTEPLRYLLESNNQYDATSLYLNTKNLNKMHKYLPPMIWLNYSPTTCDELKNDEIGVEMSRVLADEKINY